MKSRVRIQRCFRGQRSHWVGIVAMSLLLLSTGCSLELGLPEGLRVNCSESEPCSEGYICSKQHEVCVEREPICGNGEVEFPERCDDGFQDACGTCNATCDGGGTGSVCGDGELCPEFETCDDGYQDSCGTCNSSCGGPGDGAVCGDGEHCRELERCDDGFRTDCGACNADCSGVGTGALCGDGVLCEDTEMCDDGNTISEACLYGQESCIVCGASCIYEDGETSFCGDGIRNQGPELDDSDFETCDVLEDARPCTSLSPVFADGTSNCRTDCRGWDTSGCAVETADLALMVPVEAGPFLRGCHADVDLQCYGDEFPYRQIRLGQYFIDTHEVTVEAYARCVLAGGCSAENLDFDPTSCNWENGLTDREFREQGTLDGLSQLTHPINCVAWAEANQYCAWSQKRLPSEAEWEKAARGTDGRKYPWGNEPAVGCSYAVMKGNGVNCSGGSTAEVGSKELGVSPYGAYDMVGNVYEWTADWFSASYFATSPSIDPSGPDNTDQELSTRVLRGGSWLDDESANLRNSFRGETVASDRFGSIGFRCVVTR